MGEGSNICDDVLIAGPQNISLGSRVNLNERVVLQSCDGAAISIGDHVTLSYGAMILTGGYDQTKGIESRVHQSSAVVVEDRAWIGAGAIILPGVTVGRGAVVAAGAVVAQDVAPETLVAGVPARFVKNVAPLAGSLGDSES
jgi:acetyltransferase-like isoleucine patch superfamily enzyme